MLQHLLDVGRDVVGVVTQPDRPQGRGRKIAFSPVKEIALQNNLPIAQPDKIKNNLNLQNWCRDLKADLAVVVAYGKILPPALLSIPRFGFINVHASLLPKYRGAAPIQWALLNGENETGVTIFRIVEQLDAGPVMAQAKIRIDESDDVEKLTDKIFFCGNRLLLEILSLIEKGDANERVQNEAAVTLAPALTKESGEIDWRKSAREIFNRIRALKTWPIAHTFRQGKRLNIYSGAINILDLAKPERVPGQIIEVVKPVGFIVATGAGDLLVEEVQIEGGKRMSAYNYLIGHDVKIGETLPN